MRLNLEEMQQEYAADRKSIITPKPEWRHETRDRLVAVARTSNQRLQASWDKHVDDAKPPINSGLLLMLSRSPAYQARLRTVTEQIEEFDRLRGRLPSNIDEAKRPAILAERLRSLLNQLPDDIPEPVRELFQSINSGSATAAHLTDDARRVVVRTQYAVRPARVLEAKLNWNPPQNLLTPSWIG